MNKKETIYLAAGCFWGVEYLMKKANGVISTKVGFMGGSLVNPSYRDVCDKNTGHAEVVEVIYDPEIIKIENLLKLFFEIHDFTQTNGQGPDIGDQYRTEIFYTNQEQLNTAISIINQLKAKGYKVATKTTKAQNFYIAEEYHQDYYTKKGTEPYCHIRKKIF